MIWSDAAQMREDGHDSALIEAFDESGWSVVIYNGGFGDGGPDDTDYGWSVFDGNGETVDYEDGGWTLEDAKAQGEEALLRGHEIESD